MRLITQIGMTQQLEKCISLTHSRQLVTDDRSSSSKSVDISSLAPAPSKSVKLNQMSPISAVFLVALTFFFLSNEPGVYVNGAPGCNVICTLEFKPICGSDGKTYGNPCLLNAKNQCDGTAISKVADGECRTAGLNEVTCTSYEENPLVCGCPCAIRCSGVYTPLCGTDGNTYRNPCQLAVANSCVEYPVRKCYDGECRS